MRYWIGIVVLLGAALVGCERQSDASAPAAGPRLEIFYTLNEAEGVEPSYQTVVWLEDPAGKLHSLLVSEYLSYGGWKDKRVCPDWSRNVAWDKQPHEVLVAVTKATPKRQPNTYVADCDALGLAPGEYAYCVQTHIEDDYNILARGTIRIGDSAAESTAELTHTPRPHKRGAGILSDVRAVYTP